MAYMNPAAKEDAQDETLRFLSESVLHAAHAIRTKNVEGLFTECEILFLTFKTKLSADAQGECVELIKELENGLYSAGRPNDAVRATHLFRLAKRLYGLLCDHFTEVGYLMRMTRNLDRSAVDGLGGM